MSDCHFFFYSLSDFLLSTFIFLSQVPHQCCDLGLLSSSTLKFFNPYQENFNTINQLFLPSSQNVLIVWMRVFVFLHFIFYFSFQMHARVQGLREPRGRNQRKILGKEIREKIERKKLGEENRGINEKRKKIEEETRFSLTILFFTCNNSWLT